MMIWAVQRWGSAVLKALGAFFVSLAGTSTGADGSRVPTVPELWRGDDKVPEEKEGLFTPV